jgi:lysozyme family protein
MVAVAGLVLAIAPAPVQASDWGISLNVPFVRVQSHNGYYYRDNDYQNPYSYRSHHYAPENRHYYYPSQSRRQRDRQHDHWVGVDGRIYSERNRR